MKYSERSEIGNNNVAVLSSHFHNYYIAIKSNFHQKSC